MSHPTPPMTNFNRVDPRVVRLWLLATATTAAVLKRDVTASPAQIVTPANHQAPHGNMADVNGDDRVTAATPTSHQRRNNDAGVDDDDDDNVCTRARGIAQCGYTPRRTSPPTHKPTHPHAPTRPHARTRPRPRRIPTPAAAVADATMKSTSITRVRVHPAENRRVRTVSGAFPTTTTTDYHRHRHPP